MSGEVPPPADEAGLAETHAEDQVQHPRLLYNGNVNDPDIPDYDSESDLASESDMGELVDSSSDEEEEAAEAGEEAAAVQEQGLLLCVLSLLLLSLSSLLFLLFLYCFILICSGRSS